VACMLIFGEGLRHGELGRFGHVGDRGGSYWVGEAVGSVRGVQEVACSRRNWG
jgi:hypothetical protein